MSQLHLLTGREAPEAYARRYSCEGCGTLDCGGSTGPRMIVGEPGAYLCASTAWWCRPCSADLWSRWFTGAALERRRARLAEYREGRLDWQKPRPAWWPHGLPAKREAA